MLDDKQQKFFDLIGIQPGQVFKDRAFSTLYKFEVEYGGGIALKYKGEDGWDYLDYPWGVNTFINALDRLEIVKPTYILTDEERVYLENVVRPFKDKVISITLYKSVFEDRYSSIEVMYSLNENDKDNADYWHSIHLPLIDNMCKFEYMETSRGYSLKELGMFANLKITLSDFHSPLNKYAINCKTKEQALQLMKAFNKCDNEELSIVCKDISKEAKIDEVFNLLGVKPYERFNLIHNLTEVKILDDYWFDDRLVLCSDDTSTIVNLNYILDGTYIIVKKQNEEE